MYVYVIRTLYASSQEKREFSVLYYYYRSHYYFLLRQQVYPAADPHHDDTVGLILFRQVPICTIYIWIMYTVDSVKSNTASRTKSGGETETRRKKKIGLHYTRTGPCAVFLLHLRTMRLTTYIMLIILLLLL